MGELLASNVANLDVCDTEAEGRRIRVSLIGRSKSHRAVPGETASTDPACP